MTSDEANTIALSCFFGPLGWIFACSRYNREGGGTPSTEPTPPRDRRVRGEDPRHPRHVRNVVCGGFMAPPDPQQVVVRAAY